MKKVLVIAAVLACAHGVFGQGSVNFLNRVTGTSTGAQAPYYAPIYGVDPANPFLQKSGQSAAGNPVGGVVYGGALLAGTGFTVQLWGAGGANAASDASFSLLANGTSSFPNRWRCWNYFGRHWCDQPQWCPGRCRKSWIVRAARLG